MIDLHKNHQHDDLGFEREDLGGKPVFGFIVSLVVGGILIYYVIWGIFYFLDAYDKKHQQTRTPLVAIEKANPRDVQATEINRFPEPRLEENERTELDGFRQREEKRRRGEHSDRPGDAADRTAWVVDHTASWDCPAVAGESGEGCGDRGR